MGAGMAVRLEPVSTRALTVSKREPSGLPIAMLALKVPKSYAPFVRRLAGISRRGGDKLSAIPVPVAGSG